MVQINIDIYLKILFSFILNKDIVYELAGESVLGYILSIYFLGLYLMHSVLLAARDIINNYNAV